MNNNPSTIHEQVEYFRQFNRYYMSYLGYLNDKLLSSQVNLTEARVLFEINASPGCTATDVMNILRIDRGYMSRLLDRMHRRGLVCKSPSPRDGRAKRLDLTPKGLDQLNELSHMASTQLKEVITRLDKTDRLRLTQAMGTIQELLHLSKRIKDESKDSR